MASISDYGALGTSAAPNLMIDLVGGVLHVPQAEGAGYAAKPLYGDEFTRVHPSFFRGESGIWFADVQDPLARNRAFSGRVNNCSDRVRGFIEASSTQKTSGGPDAHRLHQRVEWTFQDGVAHFDCQATELEIPLLYPQEYYLSPAKNKQSYQDFIREKFLDFTIAILNLQNIQGTKIDRDDLSALIFGSGDLDDLSATLEAAKFNLARLVSSGIFVGAGIEGVIAGLRGFSGDGTYVYQHFIHQPQPVRLVSNKPVMAVLRQELRVPNPSQTAELSKKFVELITRVFGFDTKPHPFVSHIGNAVDIC